jgi:hypothetical protein
MLCPAKNADVNGTGRIAMARINHDRSRSDETEAQTSLSTIRSGNPASVLNDAISRHVYLSPHILWGVNTDDSASSIGHWRGEAFLHDSRGVSTGRVLTTAEWIGTDATPSELPHPTALGAARPSLVEGGASCFCVGACIRGGHSGSRLRRRLPFTGGSECPTPTGWTLGHNRRCALLVALEHRRKRGEHRTPPFDRRDSKRGGDSAKNSCGRCISSLLASLAEEGGLSALNFS